MTLSMIQDPCLVEQLNIRTTNAAMFCSEVSHLCGPANNSAQGRKTVSCIKATAQ